MILGSPLIDLGMLALLAATAVLLVRMRSHGIALGQGSAVDDPDEPTGRRPRFATWARQAGFQPDRLRAAFWLTKVVLALVLPLAVLAAWPALGLSAAMLALLAALAGFFVADLWLWMRRRARIRRVRNSLSYAVDLLVALLHAGLGLEPAFRRVARQGLDRDHPLAREMDLVATELEAGADRDRAFHALAERTGVSELRGVAAALRLAARHGASVASALDTQAELLRTRRRENARREVAIAATKSIFPVFLCGFPVFLVLVLFPGALELVETLRQLTGR